MHPKFSPDILKVGLLLSERGEFGRGVLRGIANFSKDHPNYRFLLAAPGRDGLEKLSSWNPDGLVATLNKTSLVPDLLAFGKPVIFVCMPHGVPEPTCVHSDDLAVGRLGAEHLLERNALAYGFVGPLRGGICQGASTGIPGNPRTGRT